MSAGRSLINYSWSKSAEAGRFNSKNMKPYRKKKTSKKEWMKIQEIRYNYHKFLYKRFKKRIKTKPS